MRKYQSNNYAGNQVGLNLGYSDAPPQVQLRTLLLKDERIAHTHVRDDLYNFVEVNAPQFTGEKGQTFTIKEVRSLQLNDDDLTKHCLEILLKHFCERNQLVEIIDELVKWNDEYKTNQN